MTPNRLDLELLKLDLRRDPARLKALREMYKRKRYYQPDRPETWSDGQPKSRRRPKNIVLSGDL